MYVQIFSTESIAGLKHDWSQTVDDVTVIIPVGCKLKESDIDIIFTDCDVKVKLAGEKPMN